MEFDYNGKTFKKTDFQFHHDFDELPNPEIDDNNTQVRHTLRNGRTLLTEEGRSGGGIITEELTGLSGSQSDFEDDILGFNEEVNLWETLPNLASTKKKQ